MVDWLQMEPFEEPDAQIQEADYIVILVDERITEFIQPYVDDVQKQQPRVIALLASEMSRRHVENVLGQSIHAFEIMSAPFGPRKMASAVAACEKAAATWTGHFRRLPPKTTLEKLKAVQSDLDVGSYLLEHKGLVIRPNNTFDRAPQTAQPSKASRLADTSPQKEERSDVEDSIQPASPRPKPSSRQDSSPNPRLLLVDDNAINLRLLETYMRKRKYDFSCAENGQLAVETFKEALQEQPAGSSYDIIFMDISMPVMDGLEATREIRKLEQKQRRKREQEQQRGQQQQQQQQGNGNRDEETNSEAESAAKEAPPSPPPPALIVALTGLANSQDQTNAFASGVDLFMTKPVKFKEIGRLLDDWLGTTEKKDASVR